MKHYEVIDQIIAQEIIAERNRLNSVEETFFAVAKNHKFDGAYFLSQNAYSSVGDVTCLGFCSQKQLSDEQKKNFKTKGKYILPKKAYSTKIKEKLGELDFNEDYTMFATWQKLVKFRIFHDGKFMKRDAVQHSFSTSDGRVFVAISANHEEANLNVNALKEIKESEYLAEQGE